MKYKVGDKVRIKSLDWYNENKDSRGNIDAAFFDEQRARFCGSIQTIANEGCMLGSGVTIYAIEDAYEFIGEEAIEGLVEEPIILNGKEVMLKLADIELPSGTIDIWKLPDGYQFVDENGNVINATKIVLEKKKKEYPKTFKECQNYLGEDVAPMVEPISKTHRRKSVHLLEILLTCRDAYWKIAGEEMGWGKPWEPDWTDDNAKYSIYTIKGALTKAISCYDGAILAFPTEEMRDAFYENFKELIEQCKELL